MNNLPHKVLATVERDPKTSRSDHYIWRYVRPDEQSLADAMDDLD